MMKIKTILVAVTAMCAGILFFLLPAGGAARKGTPAVGSSARTGVTVRLYDSQGKLSGGYTMNKIVKTDAEWRQQLTSEQYTITRAKGTEPAFCGNLTDTKEEGIYTCVCCGLPLFSSETKFHSGTGWPSFFAPVAKENLTMQTDHGYGMIRNEILCARCDAHLGHVFEDGPQPTGLRYCLNSAALIFIPKAEYLKQHGLQTATFAMGCFWHVEDLFRHVPGVVDAVSGYTGGHLKNPTYKDVCSGRTGHAESVQVTFDPAQVSYPTLLKAFWENHDPTTPNRQGPDVGSQYRSVIFYHTPEQKAAAETAKAAQEKAGAYERPIVTEIVPAATFYRAEEYHQRYLEKHGKAACAFNP